MRHKRLSAFALALLLSSSPALAHSRMSLGGVGNSTPPVPYAGPGNISSFVMWGGLRAYSFANMIAGSAAIKLCTASDANGCPDVHVTLGGGLSSADIVSAGCAAIDTCTVKQIYDQSGGGFAWVQNTEALRATYNRTCTPQGKPCLVFTRASSQMYTVASVPSISQPFSMTSVVYQNTSLINTYFAATNVSIGSAAGANTARIAAGSNLDASGVTNATLHAIQWTFNNTACETYVDGAVASGGSGTCGTGVPTTSMALGCTVAAGNCFGGRMTEIGMSAGAYSSEVKARLDLNERNYY